MSENIDKLTCEAALDRLDDYVAGRLDGEGAALLEAHLSSCDRCAHEYAELSELTKMIAAAAQEPPSSMRESVMAGIAAQRNEAKRLARIRYMTRWSAIAAGAVLVLAVAATGVIGRMTKSSSDMAEENSAAKKSGIAAETYATAAYSETADTNEAMYTADEYTKDALMDEAPMMMMALPSEEPSLEKDTAAAEDAGESGAYGGEEIAAETDYTNVTGNDMNALTTSGGGTDTESVNDGSGPRGQIQTSALPQWIAYTPSKEEKGETDKTAAEQTAEPTPERMPDGSGYTYTAGAPYMSDPLDMPFTAVVSDPQTAVGLVGADELNEWGNTAYVTLDARERTRLPLLALVVRDFGVGVKSDAPTRDDLRDVLMRAGFDSDGATALADTLIDGGDDEIRRACIGEHASLVNGDILTERWVEAHPDKP